MPRYIDADAKIEEIKNIRLEKQRAGVCYEGDLADIVFNIIINHIKNAPTADVEEVVHCKDCKHLMFSDMYGECGHAILGIVSPDDYCSRGERRKLQKIKQQKEEKK